MSIVDEIFEAEAEFEMTHAMEPDVIHVPENRMDELSRFCSKGLPDSVSGNVIEFRGMKVIPSKEAKIRVSML